MGLWSFSYFRRLNSEIFGAERHILLNDRRNDLIVGILKDDADGLPDLIFETFVRRVHPVDKNFARFRRKNRVRKLGKR